MKALIVTAATAAALLLLTACGGSVCSRNESLKNSLNAKTKANCPDEGGFEGSVANCEAKVKSCNGDDQAKMHKWYDCMEALPVCAAGQGEAWSKQFIGCASSLQGISSACFTAITGDDGD